MTPQMLQHTDWKYRHAALMAISATGEGCHKQMESYLGQIMEGVMNFVNDPVSSEHLGQEEGGGGSAPSP